MGAAIFHSFLCHLPVLCRQLAVTSNCFPALPPLLSRETVCKEKPLHPARDPQPRHACLSTSQSRGTLWSWRPCLRSSLVQRHLLGSPVVASALLLLLGQCKGRRRAESVGVGCMAANDRGMHFWTGLDSVWRSSSWYSSQLYGVLRVFRLCRAKSIGRNTGSDSYLWSFKRWIVHASWITLFLVCFISHRFFLFFFGF